MKSLYIDTNVLVSFLTKRDNQQSKQITKIFQEAQEEKIQLVVIPEIIIETFFVLQSNYFVNKRDIYESLKHLVSSIHLEVKNRALLLSALEIYNQTNVSLLDAYLYASAKDAGAEVFSFDKDLEKLKRRF